MALTDLKAVGFPAAKREKVQKLLESKYPDFGWDKTELFRGRFAQQRKLERGVETLFPVSLWMRLMNMFSFGNMQGLEIKINVRKEAGIRSPGSDSWMEVDVFIPALKLGFEFQVRIESHTEVFTLPRSGTTT